MAGRTLGTDSGNCGTARRSRPGTGAGRGGTVRLLRGVIAVALTVALAGCAGLAGAGNRASASHEFFLGNIWKNGTTDDADFLTYWDQVTPENGGKWANVERERDVMDWSDLDNAYRFAEAHGLPFRFHTLMWGQSHPLWLRGLSPEEQREEVDEWFALVAERYPGIDFIDVVNEPLHSEPFTSESMGGWGETGYDWVIWTFELARKHFPNAVLQTNDYGILASAALTGGYVRLATLLRERGLLDAIGIQAHGLENADVELARENLDRLAAAGVPLYITELDLAFRDDQAQLEKMRELVTLFTSHPAVAGITLWGYRRGEIFSANAWLLDTDGSERPALTWLREHRAGL